MTVPFVVLAGILGLLIGSFLNVVIWRLPREESLSRPASHCPSCEHPIRPYDNVPVVSWLVLRGRCRDCRAPISARYPAVELVTGIVFAALAWRIGWHVAVLGFLFLAAIGVALAMIDVDTKRLPNKLTFPGYAVGIAVLAADAAVRHSWWPFERALIGMAALYGFYFLLVLVYPKGMGFGDVKLAGVLGLFLGYLGWGALVVGAFLGFLVGGIVGAGLMLFTGAGRKTKIPYGPYMLAGALIAIFAGHEIARAYLDVTFGR